MEAFRWYVAAALAGLEATAVYHLSRAGIAAFSPSFVDRTGQFARTVKLFPGYLFVELSAPEREYEPEFQVAEAGIVRRTRGVHGMLPIHARCPDPLPVGLVEDLRARANSGALDADAALETVRRYAPGDDVPIESGPWSGWTGEMVRYRKGSLVVLLALLGAKREVTIPSHQVAGGGAQPTVAFKPRVSHLNAAARTSHGRRRMAGARGV